jgi:hypothetical protein
MDRGAHARAAVGWARRDDAKFGVRGESAFHTLLDDVEGLCQAVPQVVELGALLHAHDAQVVFLAYPDDEALVSRVVATATIGPLAGNASGEQVLIVGHVLEHDMILYQLLVGSVVDEPLGAGGERVVLTTKFATLVGDLVKGEKSERHRNHNHSAARGP